MPVPFYCRVVARLLAVLVAGVALPTAAKDLTCPLPVTLVQVAGCQGAEQLRQSYIGYCSDNRRMYGRDSDTCTSFESFLAAKNTALWESADRAFEGYLSCQAPGLPAALPQPTMRVERSGAITVLSCRYGTQATLTHRTRARCTLVDAAVCSDPSPASAAACRARCE